MKQITQKLKDGKMQVLEVSVPVLSPGCVLVRNHYSLISAGTESSTVKAARSSYIQKAMERPQQIKQVMNALKSQGPMQTYRAVMKKLDAYSPLGYSCTGQVIEVASDVKGFIVGDLVACAGLTASHAEIVAVPVNLCVKLSPDSDLKFASYNALGAIALQGIRQADLRLGETCAVIGLGLIGQLAALLLKASGVKVIGVDVRTDMVAMAAQHCADVALKRDDDGIEDKIMQFTGSIGCDAVIISAATDSLDPINFAGKIARKKGTIVVLGAVPTGFDREPHYYRKELQVKMSCSYGPGRYDPSYEEKGIDYPSAYVRWTEKRNMEAFQDLIYNKKIDVSYLTTHIFKLDDAPKAYDMMMAKSEPFIGILIEYDTGKEIARNRIFLKSLQGEKHRAKGVAIGFIGAGSYAQSHLLPNIPKHRDVVLKGVLTASGTGARSVAERFGFEFCAGDEKDILENGEINTIFIATRHDSHADYVLKALRARKHVFVEKPLCLTPAELEEIRIQMSDTGSQTSGDGSSILMVGYNRRFSPLAARMKEQLDQGPMAMTYRVNAGAVPADSWIQDPDIGGGRIVGEICHFVDFLTYINGSMPVSVYAHVLDDPNHLNDTLSISISFLNGSIGTISYFANGDKSLPKERIEVFAHGCTVVLDDFVWMSIHSNGRKKTKKLIVQDKGQKTEVAAFIDSVLNGKSMPIPFEELHSTSLVTFKILESIQTGRVMDICSSVEMK